MTALRGPISINNAGSGAEMGPEFAMSQIERPVRIELMSIEEAIEAGQVPVEAVTGGVRVDAETGEVEEPKAVELDWDESKVIQDLKREGARVAKGMRRFNSRTFRRPKKDNPTASPKVSASSDSRSPTMPRRTTVSERQKADSVLKRHNRTKATHRTRFA